MVKFRLSVLLAFLAVACMAAAGAADIYVSQSTGKKKAAGTKEDPFKAMFDALNAAKPGDTLHVAEGSYAGKAGVSQIIIEKPVTILGGYTADFSARDVLKHPTLVQPKNEKNDTKGLGVVILKLPAGKQPPMTLDGLVIDQGLMNSYHDTKGKPEGVETGMYLDPPAKNAADKFPSAKTYSLYSETQGRYEGDLTIRNCVFANASMNAVNVSQYAGTVKVLNNVFIANRLEACNVSCSNAKAGALEVEFAYNTVFFTWSRLDDLADMGYGFRCMTNVNCNIHHNIFGLNVFAGVDNAKGNPKSKKIKLDNNVFFLNRIADVTQVVSPNILKVKVGTEEFDDMADFDGMESVEGNVSVKDPALFKGAINQAYLSGFLNVTYTEKTSYDENSPANVFREAMGMNKVGKIETKVSMFANRYPLADAYKLFGVYKDYGAQAIK